MIRGSLLVLMLAAALCGCGSGQTSSIPKVHPSTSSSSSASTAPAGCPFKADTVARLSTLGAVDVQPLGHVSSPVTTATSLTCSAKVTVESGGSAEVRYDNGTAAICQLWQDDASKTAGLVSRDQAHDFFALTEGKVVCSWPATSPQQPVHMCDVGTLFVSGEFQGDITCHQEPFFQVAIMAGSARVTAPGLDMIVEAGQELTYDLTTEQYKPIQPAEFSANDVMALDAQAQALGLPVTLAPQTIQFISQPTNPMASGTYTVQVQAGGSSSPVTFTVDQSSGKVCSKISSDTFRFNLQGLCTIDANQAGDTLFQAAPQAQQQITVAASTSPPPPG